MNIFYLSADPKQAALWMVDKHVVKMILESAQLLSTAHRILDGQPFIDTTTGRKIKRWKLPNNLNEILYTATHANHPSAIWVRQSNNNYNWLYCHFVELLKEYSHRYSKIHKCNTLIDYLKKPPKNIPVTFFTPPPPAMPDKYIVSDSVQSYQNYYREGKKHLHNYTKRTPPAWLL